MKLVSPSPGHPLWQCGLRPFFSAATAAALLAIAPWLAWLAWPALPLLPIPSMGPLPPTQWHALLLLGGMGLAAVAGFMLTAVPEFTASAGFAPRPLRVLAVLWLLGFAGDVLGQRWSLALAMLAWLAFVARLAMGVLPRVWAQPQRPHLSFAWALAALGVGIGGWHAALLIGDGSTAARWPPLLTAVYMALVVLAMSRISMRIVNDALDDEARRAGRTHAAEPYLARPPRRKLLIALIAAQALVQALWPAHKAGGWLALAAGAAVLNVLHDWHVGRALLRRWPLLLYAVYLAMASGYLALGAGLLAEHGGWQSAGRHALSLAVFGLSIYGVFMIAGRNHIGLPLDTRPWVLSGALLLPAAALLRGAWSVTGTAWLLPASGLAWLAAFGLVAWRLLPLWWRPRADGLYGCQGPGGGDERC
jgi:uncharacterized protein involved in response to NO